MGCLPTREKMFANAEAALDRAEAALGDAADWLRSNWTPPDSPLTGDQAQRRVRMPDGITRAKQAIGHAKN